MNQAGLSRLATAASKQDGQNSPDGLWERIEDTQSLLRQNQAQIQPESFRVFRLNRELLRGKLGGAPLESSAAAKDALVEMTLPMPDGRFLRLRIEESPMMEPGLAAKFPEIKTYQGQGIDDPSVYARFGWTLDGFHALVLRYNDQGDAVQISPRVKGNLDEYLSYATKDVPSPSDLRFQCGALELRDTNNARSDNAVPAAPAIAFGTTLRTYRLAVAATTRWTNTYGGNTPAGAVSAITTVMNQVNAIYRTELSVRMVLVANNDQIVYPTTFSGTYPYTDTAGDNATGTTNGENQTNIDNVILNGNYDIGHIFGVFQSGQFAGLASVGVVCNANKARGSSMFGGGLTTNPFNLYVVAHEMGHQFGATHSFNASCQGNRTAGSAWEPDSGSTIMSYGSNNCQGGSGLQNNADLYFQGGNLTQIINYINGSAGCATTVASGNTPPNVNAGANFTIPQQTPFALTATGSDPDGHAVTFSWEQLDLGSQSPPNSDDGTRPLFRSFPGSSSPTRTFPSLNFILNFANVPPATFNGFVTGETLPATNRTMNFQVTA
ncbi:MAG: reprolysin-like metallopeptidase, partial [Blastocatellia bacterium]